eukprot:1245929-Pleurochrysis_carterae.AAC.2
MLPRAATPRRQMRGAKRLVPPLAQPTATLLARISFRPIVSFKERYGLQRHDAWNPLLRCAPNWTRFVSNSRHCSLRLPQTSSMHHLTRSANRHRRALTPRVRRRNSHTGSRPALWYQSCSTSPRSEQPSLSERRNSGTSVRYNTNHTYASDCSLYAFAIVPSRPDAALVPAPMRARAPDAGY